MLLGVLHSPANAAMQLKRIVIVWASAVVRIGRVDETTGEARLAILVLNRARETRQAGTLHHSANETPADFWISASSKTPELAG